jgi:polysaccharide export outer membrane protein
MTNIHSFFAVALLLAACATPPSSSIVITPPPRALAPDATALAPAADVRYVLGAGDEIEIRVPDRADLNLVAKVRPDGYITVPMIGAVRAAGRSAEQVEEEVARRLRALGAAPSDAPRSYLLAVGDLLEVKLANHPEFNQSERIRPDGKISLPLVKTVNAEGRTPESLENELSERYSRILKRVDLVVIVREYTSQKIMVGGRVARAGLEDVRPTVLVRLYGAAQIFVGGEVARPGVIAYRAPLTALQAIVEAGGDKATAEMRSVMVMRKVGAETPRVIRMNLREDLDDNATNDFFLQPNDVLIVPKTDVANLATFLDQYLFQILPPLRNSSFGFVYDLRGSTTTTLRTTGP